MAPPSNRRAGFSKRAQYSAFTGYVLAAIGALVGAVLLVVSLWRPATFEGMRTSATDVAAPAGEAGAVGRSASRNVYEIVTGYVSAGRQNAELRREAELARIRLAEAAALHNENRRLKALLAMRDADSAPVAVARLVGATSSSTRRFAYLGAGSNQGVRVGMPVRSPRGIVGRILEAGRSSSRVMLLTDNESVVPVRRAQDDVVAFAEGRADGSLRIRLINLGINPLRKGDVFVTSGAGGLYRPGIAVAVVDRLTRDGAIARVLSDPAGTDFVTVEPIWQPEARAVADPAADSAIAGAPPLPDPAR